MSELLRKANELVEETEDSISSGSIDNIYNFADKTVDVIKGYQRMIEAAISLMEHAHFTREWRQLETVADLWIETARESIPGARE